jgi:transcriptional regulator with XRE-family HTH domain
MQMQSDADHQRMTMVKQDIIKGMCLQPRIGRILRWGRKKKNITVKQFAALLGITPKKLTLIEQGKASPPMCLLGQAFRHLHFEVHTRIEVLMTEVAILMRDEVPRRMTIH